MLGCESSRLAPGVPQPLEFRSGARTRLVSCVVRAVYFAQDGDDDDDEEGGERSLSRRT